MMPSNKISIEQLASELGCSRSLVRFWEEEFELTPRPHAALNALEVAEFKLIHQFIEVQGLPLDEAKMAFNLNRPRLAAKYETIEGLTRLRHALLQLKSQVEERAF